MGYVHAIGETVSGACSTFDGLIGDVSGALKHVRANWDAELEAVFTPNNDRYAGHLPVLDTSDEDIRRLYLTGAVGVVYFKRG